MFFDGFILVFQDCWIEEIKEEMEGVYFMQYSDDQFNILLVGLIFGDEY